MPPLLGSDNILLDLVMGHGYFLFLLLGFFPYVV